MEEKHTRRAVLKATAASGTAATIVARKSDATLQTVRTVEAGIYYDLEIRSGYSRTRLDSRPLFTINEQKKELILAERAHSSRVDSIFDEGTFMNGESIEKGHSKAIRKSGVNVGTLPIALSNRMRPMLGVDLATKHSLPRVVIKREESTHQIITSSGIKKTLPIESERKVYLDPRDVEVTTVEITGEQATIEGIPQERTGPKRECDSVKVEATPVIEVVDHGVLTVRQRRFP